MFGIGIVEIFIILVVVLVVIGPERLPDAARHVGLFVRKVRQFIHEISSNVILEEELPQKSKEKKND